MTVDQIQVLFIIDYFHRTGGTETHLVQLIEGLSRDIFDCSIVVFDLGENPLLDRLRALGVPIISLPVGREYVPNAAIQAWKLSRLVHRNRYDIVQTFHQKADTYGALVARLSGARRLVSSKRDTGALRRPWHRFLNRRLKWLFDAIIVVSRAVGVAAVENDRLPGDRVVTIYNGVDTVRFTPPSPEQRQTARRSLGLVEDDFVVGVVAGFRQEKNHDVFFQALSAALPSIASLKALVIGAGPLLREFRERVAQTELRSRTLFTGDVTDVAPYLWAMDVGCLTAGSNEGFSNAILEQMSAGLPMIVTDVGGNAEAVVDQRNGIIIPPMDQSALRAALIALYSDRSRREAMGRESRRRVEERFTIEKMCAEHAKLYVSLMSHRDTSSPRTVK